MSSSGDRPPSLSDGDAILQARKILRSGLWQAFGGAVLIYVHKEKELHDVERRFPAAHYTLIDDKARILVAVKAVWGDRVTTIFPKQGHHAVEDRRETARPLIERSIRLVTCCALSSRSNEFQAEAHGSSE
jgi:hypothetical protein